MINIFPGSAADEYINGTLAPRNYYSSPLVLYKILDSIPISQLSQYHIIDIMTQSPRSVLITGCSDGGMGASLALAFQAAGFKVYATARNINKMSDLKSKGIDTYELDVTSTKSIAACREIIPALDILINNAGNQYTMPAVDVDLNKAKEIYDLNVWAHIAMAQAFLPLLRKSSNPMIVNHTSIAGFTPIPFQSVYNSSKAAAAVLSDTLRLELLPLGIKVVDLRTGLVQTNLIKNRQLRGDVKLPPNSVYEPARAILEETLLQDEYVGAGLTADQWAEEVVKELLNNPPPAIWKGETADMVQQAITPIGAFDDFFTSRPSYAQVGEAIKKAEGKA